MVSGDIKTNLDGALTAEIKKPLVNYRKKDEHRRQQINEFHDTVADKVSEVMASFKASPSITQLHEEAILQKHRSRRRKTRTKNAPGSVWFWVFGVLLLLSIVLMVIGWMH